jgi:Family of unknown function (DUF5908)
MPVVIREIVTEVVLVPHPTTTTEPPSAEADLADDAAERIVRRAAERVLDILRREWDR